MVAAMRPEVVRGFSMRIGILSDTHNRYRNVEKALRLLKDRGVTLVLHCGDIEDAQTVRLFQGFTTHFVFGNCDSDKTELRQAMQESGATLHDHFGSLELEGRMIAWTHGDDARLKRDIEQSGAYDFLFYGHSHHAERHRTGKTVVVNPGALHRAREKTFVILDLRTGELEDVLVPEAG
jgi:putative phosphoesterase